MKIGIGLNTLLGMTDFSVLPKKHGFSLDKIAQTDRQTIRFIYFLFTNSKHIVMHGSLYQTRNLSYIYLN